MCLFFALLSSVSLPALILPAACCGKNRVHDTVGQ